MTVSCIRSVNCVGTRTGVAGYVFAHEVRDGKGHGEGASRVAGVDFADAAGEEAALQAG